MKLFNYKISVTKIEHDAFSKYSEIKKAILDSAEENARSGLVKARLELCHHTLLLEQLEIKLPATEEEKKELEREIQLTKDAIKRDEKSITNWETQIKAINYERN